MVTVDIKVYAGEDKYKHESTLTVTAEVSGGSDAAHDRQVASQVGARLLTALGSIEQVGGGAIRSTYVIPVTMPEAVDVRAPKTSATKAPADESSKAAPALP